MSRLSVIIPTCGRETLGDTLRSLVLREEDEVIVVADGSQPKSREICQAFGSVRYFETEPTGFYGHYQRQTGMGYATGTHLLFQDDDDVYVDGAFDSIRRAIVEFPDRPILGQMIFGDHYIYPKGYVLWETKELKLGNVSTQMLILPNVAQKFGRWGSNITRGVKGGDFAFMQSLGYSVTEFAWWPEVFAELRHP